MNANAPIVDERTLRVLSTAAAFALCLTIAYVAHRTLLVLVFALLFAYLMEPVVSRVQRKFRGRRAAAVAVTYLAFWLAIGGLFFALGKQLNEQSHRLTQAAPAYLEKVKSGEIAKEIGQKRGWSEQTQQRVASALRRNSDRISNVAKTGAIYAAELATNLPWVIFVPLLAMVFPKEKMAFPVKVVETFIAGPRRAFWRSVVMDCDRMFADYMWANVVLSVIAFSAYAMLLGLMEVQFWLLIAALGSIFEFIFVVGPLATGVLVMVAVIASGKNWTAALIFLAVFRVIQDYVITPLVMKEELKMHPLAVLAAVFIGGELYGGLGIFLAIPAAAAIRIMWRRYQQVRGQMGERQAQQLTAA